MNFDKSSVLHALTSVVVQFLPRSVRQSVRKGPHWVNPRQKRWEYEDIIINQLWSMTYRSAASRSSFDEAYFTSPI